MLGGIHFFVGSALGVGLTNYPWQAFLVGVISHHLLDSLPHLDTNLFGENDVLFEKKDWRAWLIVSLEFVFFILITFYFLSDFNSKIQKIGFWGGLGAILPDVFSIILGRLKFKKPPIIEKYLYFHKKIFHYQKIFNFHFEKKWLIIVFCLLIESLVFIGSLSFLIFLL